MFWQMKYLATQELFSFCLSQLLWVLVFNISHNAPCPFLEFAGWEASEPATNHLRGRPQKRRHRGLHPNLPGSAHLAMTGSAVTVENKASAKGGGGEERHIPKQAMHKL